MAKVGRRARSAPPPSRRWIWIGASLVLVAALAYAAYSGGPTGEPPRAGEGECTPTGLHEHASFGVFVHNESVRWTDARWDFGRGNGALAGHLHLPADHTIHIEGGRRECTTVAKFFRTTLGSELRPDHLTLDAIQHDGRMYRDGEGGALRFFLRTADGAAWSEEPQLPFRQPRDGDYLLVTFGDEDASAIAWQQGTLPPPDPSE